MKRNEVISFKVDRRVKEWINSELEKIGLTVSDFLGDLVTKTHLEGDLDFLLSKVDPEVILRRYIGKFEQLIELLNSLKASTESTIDLLIAHFENAKQRLLDALDGLQVKTEAVIEEVS